MKITIQVSSNIAFDLNIEENASIDSLKNAIRQISSDSDRYPLELRLFFAGTELIDKNISEYGITVGSLIYLVVDHKTYALSESIELESLPKVVQLSPNRGPIYGGQKVSISVCCTIILW